MNLKFKVLATEQSKLKKHSSRLRQSIWSIKDVTFVHHHVMVVPISNHCGLGEQDGSVKLENTFQKCEECVSGS